jgi:hypothetical protein
MLRCAFCKAQEAQSEEYGIPICHDCLDVAKLESVRNTCICFALVQNLIYATSRFEAASLEVNSTIGDILSGLNASPKLTVAWKDKECAYDSLEDHLSRGMVPEYAEAVAVKFDSQEANGISAGAGTKSKTLLA